MEPALTPNPLADPLGWLQATGDRSWLTTAQAGELLGISPARLCRLRRRGRTPSAGSLRISRQVILWSADEVERWATLVHEDEGGTPNPIGGAEIAPHPYERVRCLSRQ